MPSAAEYEELVDDASAEHDDLDAIVSPLDAGRWDLATPAAGWAIRDQISHLAYFDELATMAMADPEAFVPRAERATALAMAGEDPMAEHLQRGRAMSAASLLEWWRRERVSMLAQARGFGPQGRVPWFGPSMSPMSFVSARLMETWAHGQDVADALGLVRRPTARLAHIALIGVRARPFSYAVRGLELPAKPVRVELEGPGAEHWLYESEGEGSVVGTALDFCLVVTQRRHLLDTALVVSGSAARQWMEVAQAFAGPPGPGRAPLGA